MKKRAAIVKIGMCEQIDDNGTWSMSGWMFDHGGDRSLFWPCPWTHDENHIHVGFAGWTFEELKAVSDADFELAGLETTESPS